MRPFCLEVTGDYACFTRPEMKVERVSYDLITPSAARAVFDAILWKPAIRWRICKIEVLKPVRWISVRRNEVSSVVSTAKALQAMKAGHGELAIYVDDSKERAQRAGLFLRDVAYRLYAEMEFLTDESRGNPAKYTAMFTRRAAAGQCVNQPYLGCREFAASFRPVPVLETGRGAYGVAETEPAALQDMSADLGWMLYDLDYADRGDPKPQFFRARVERGVMDLTGVEVRG